MSPYERINTYRTPRGRRWFAAALPWMFVIGVAAVTMLPVRQWMHGLLPGSADSQAARDAEMVWRRAGSPRCAPPRRCDPHHRWRHVRGAGSSAAGPQSDHAGSSARHRRAGVEGRLCAGIADGRGRDRGVARRCSAKAMSGSSISGRTSMAAGSWPTSPRGAAAMFRPRCSPQVMPAATAAAIAAAGARTQASRLRNEKAAPSRGFFYIYSICNQRVTVTVVPTETR